MTFPKFIKLTAVAILSALMLPSTTVPASAQSTPIQNLKLTGTMDANNQNINNAKSVQGWAYGGDVAVSTNFTVLTTQRGLIFDVTTGSSAITATLPSAATAGNGFFIVLRKADSGVGSIVTSPTTSPSATSIWVQNHETRIWTDGTSWYHRDAFGSTDVNGNQTISAGNGGTLTLNAPVVGQTFTGTNSPYFVYAGFVGGGNYLQLGGSRDGHSFDRMNTLTLTTHSGGFDCQRDINVLCQANDTYRRALKVNGYYWATATSGNFGITGYLCIYKSADLLNWNFVTAVSPTGLTVAAATTLSFSSGSSTVTLPGTAIAGLTNGRVYNIQGVAGIPTGAAFVYNSGSVTQTIGYPNSTTALNGATVVTTAPGTTLATNLVFINNTWNGAWYTDGTNYYISFQLSQTNGANYGAPGIGYVQMNNVSAWQAGAAPTFGNYVNIGLPANSNGAYGPFLIGSTYVIFSDLANVNHYATSSSPLSGYVDQGSISSHFNTDAGSGGCESSQPIQITPTLWRFYFANISTGAVWYSESSNVSGTAFGSATWTTAQPLGWSSILEMSAGCPFALTNYDEIFSAMAAQSSNRLFGSDNLATYMTIPEGSFNIYTGGTYGNGISGANHVAYFSQFGNIFYYTYPTGSAEFQANTFGSPILQNWSNLFSSANTRHIGIVNDSAGTWALSLINDDYSGGDRILAVDDTASSKATNVRMGYNNGYWCVRDFGNSSRQPITCIPSSTNEFTGFNNVTSPAYPVDVSGIVHTSTLFKSDGATASTMAKWDSSKQLISATSGTDFAPATSGSSVLKANGSGGFANVVFGTDLPGLTSGNTYNPVTAQNTFISGNINFPALALRVDTNTAFGNVAGELLRLGNTTAGAGNKYWQLIENNSGDVIWWTMDDSFTYVTSCFKMLRASQDFQIVTGKLLQSSATANTIAGFNGSNELVSKTSNVDYVAPPTMTSNATGTVTFNTTTNNEIVYNTSSSTVGSLTLTLPSTAASGEFLIYQTHGTVTSLTMAGQTVDGWAGPSSMTADSSIEFRAIAANGHFVRIR